MRSHIVYGSLALLAAGIITPGFASRAEAQTKSGVAAPAQEQAKAKAAEQAVPEDVELRHDVVYGKGGEVELKLDIYRPRPLPDQPLPVIVYIHGGGWKSGRRIAAPTSSSRWSGAATAA